MNDDKSTMNPTVPMPAASTAPVAPMASVDTSAMPTPTQAGPMAEPDAPAAPVTVVEAPAMPAAPMTPAVEATPMPEPEALTSQNAQSTAMGSTPMPTADPTTSANTTQGGSQ